MIGVAGATGGLGGRIAARLAERGVAAATDRARPGAGALAPGRRGRPGAATTATARRCAARSTASTSCSCARRARTPTASRCTARAVDAAAAAGVGRLVYTSFVGAAPDCVFTFGRDHFHTEEHIRASGVGFTFLRDSIYLDYIPFFTSAEGIIQGPAGDGRVGAVARDDIADVAVEALLDAQHEGRAYEVTGREAFTLAEAAEILTRHDRPRGPLRRGDDRGGARLTRAERRPRLGDRGLGDHLHLDRRGRARRRHGHRRAGGGARASDARRAARRPAGLWAHLRG